MNFQPLPFFDHWLLGCGTSPSNFHGNLRMHCEDLELHLEGPSESDSPQEAMEKVQMLIHIQWFRKSQYITIPVRYVELPEAGWFIWIYSTSFTQFHDVNMDQTYQSYQRTHWYTLNFSFIVNINPSSLISSMAGKSIQPYPIPTQCSNFISPMSCWCCLHICLKATGMV